MDKPVKLSEKYERNGWPSLSRPDLKPPDGWSLSLITSLERIRSHSLSSRGDIAFIKDGESTSDVFTMSADGGWPARITTDRAAVPYWDDEIPQWSPDGEWLAFTMRGHVHIVPRAGGLPKSITDFTFSASGPRWMPDSTGLIVTVERDGADQLVLTNREGAWPRALTTDSIGDHWDPHPSADGKSILYLLRRFDDLNRLDIVVLDLGNGQARTLYSMPSTRALSPRWSPASEWIAFTSQQSGFDELYLVRPNGEGLHALTSIGQDVVQFEWSPDGKRLAAIVNHGGSFEIMLIETASGARSELRSVLGIHANPNWSGDGGYLTFEFESPSLPPDIYRVQLSDRSVTQLTLSNPPALQQNHLVIPQVVSYKSFDDREIPSMWYQPAHPNGAAILYPHGGPMDQYVFGFDELAQYFVAKGYAYLAPNYRGSTGYGREFERANHDDWGGGDARDCLFGARWLRGMPSVKPERIAITGGSYGGYLTACCLARDPDYLFACGISKYGDTNLLSSWAQCEKRLRLYTEMFLGHPRDALEVYRRGSPIHEVANTQKPVLILHGLLDTIVPPEASEEWVEALRRESKVFEYKTYAEEPHGFLHRANLLDAYARIERFLDWYLVI